MITTEELNAVEQEFSQPCYSDGVIRQLVAEVRQLRTALADAIPWLGLEGYGPEWADDSAKIRNAEQCEAAIEQACRCFPDDFSSIEELQKENGVGT